MVSKAISHIRLDIFRWKSAEIEIDENRFSIFGFGPIPLTNYLTGLKICLPWGPEKLKYDFQKSIFGNSSFGDIVVYSTVFLYNLMILNRFSLCFMVIRMIFRKIAEMTRPPPKVLTTFFVNFKLYVVYWGLKCDQGH